MKITLFIPTLNEEEGLKAIMPRVPHYLFDQILVVDGQSQDNTVQVAQDMGYDVYIQQQKGIRHAYIEAWPLIKGDIVLTFSPDGNCIPEDLLLLVDKIKEGYDMVIASRYYQGAKSEDDDLITTFGNWLFSSLISFIHCAKYTDAMTIYRIYRKDLFYELDLDKEETYTPEKFFHTTIGIEPILSIRAAKMKLRVGEIPSDEPKRVAGERKLQVIRWGGSYMLQVFREIFYWHRTKVKVSIAQ